jgi:hypothetical protein
MNQVRKSSLHPAKLFRKVHPVPRRRSARHRYSGQPCRRSGTTGRFRLRGCLFRIDESGGLSLGQVAPHRAAASARRSIQCSSRVRCVRQSARRRASRHSRRWGLLDCRCFDVRSARAKRERFHVRPWPRQSFRRGSGRARGPERVCVAVGPVACPEIASTSTCCPVT